MVYVFLAEGFEEAEALTPVDILRRGGLEVKTVGVGAKTVTGAHSIPVVCDMSENDVDFSDIEAVVLPGGMPGTINLENSKAVKDTVGFARKNGKIIGAICAAPSILGKMGILAGKKATCFPGFEKYLTGAVLSNLPAVRDGNIITAVGAGAAFKFGFCLLAALKGQDVADRLSVSMKYI